MVRDNTPVRGYTYWSEHPEAPLADWQYEVASGDTRVGYWTWVRSVMQANKVYKKAERAHARRQD